MKSPLRERIQWEIQLHILKNYTERENGIILYEKIQNSKFKMQHQVSKNTLECTSRSIIEDASYICMSNTGTHVKHQVHQTS